MRHYEKGMSKAERAVQAWNILIGTAANRQTITYGDLNELMGYGSNHLGGVLVYLRDFCTANDLPRLPYLVVNAGAGAPGGIEETSFAEWSEIYKINWYQIVPPTVKELLAIRNS